MPAIAETIANLDKARNLVLSDAVYYKEIVPAILPTIGASQALELRRWGADFLAEAFAAPTFPADKKQETSIAVLQTLKDLLELQPEDTGTVKSVVQAAASIYPLVFRYVISNPGDASTWQKMAAIKSNILRRMDSAKLGVRICCIKFVQRVVQVQTPGVIADPRVRLSRSRVLRTYQADNLQRPEQNEISIALVPRDHPLIPPKNLEPEASGLLDRLLSTLQDGDSNALLVDATLNSFGVLVRTRPSIATKIVSTVLNFNPFRHANTSISPRTKVEMRSMERTARAFMTSILKMPKMPPHLQGQAPRMQQHVERLMQMRHEVLEGGGARKRPAPAEPTDGLDNAKRQRLGAEVPAPTQGGTIPPLPPGPVSVAQLFTLTSNNGAQGFDVSALPFDLVSRILVPLIASTDKSKLDNAVNAVRSRYLHLTATPPASALGAANVATGVSKAPGEEEDDDYEPDYEPTENTDQVMNKLDKSSLPAAVPEQAPVALGPFRLPTPPPITDQESEECGKMTIRRVFGAMTELDDRAPTRANQFGFNRLAASNHDRDAWVTFVSRLASRASAGLEQDEASLKTEDGDSRKLNLKHRSLSDMVRETLYIYILEDFRRRIDVAISWLSEEWYNDRLQAQQGESTPDHYGKWSLKVLDGIVPYIDANDKKAIIRFMSEIPGLSREMLERVKNLARDPERVSLTVQSLQFLIMFRPPARDMAIDALEDLYRNNQEARPSAAKLLKKWRPNVLEEVTASRGTEMKIEG
ncbi:MAG: hypothetical protein M1820_003474 [Bogoriella megaspora]|nr:MAG: hypothetical protein M1820_003474 [Bogoriella megaspora]